MRTIKEIEATKVVAKVKFDIGFGTQEIIHCFDSEEHFQTYLFGNHYIISWERLEG